jgi:hypothetical protein
MTFTSYGVNMVHSKNKGAAGERELAKEVARLLNCSARRGA